MTTPSLTHESTTARARNNGHKYLSDECELLERENQDLREALNEAISQLSHVEDLRRSDNGPIPATLSPDIIARGKQLMANAEGETRRPSAPHSP